MKDINTKSLQALCDTHSVAGDTLEVIEYLKNRLSKLGIAPKTSGYGVLLFGNVSNPKIHISAHADEIGFQIVKKNDDGTWLVSKSGHVDAVMLNNNSVYVNTDKGKIFGFFYPKLALGNNKPEHFSEIFLDTTDNAAIQTGDFGSYARQFFQNGHKIMATGLDNKIGVEMILELVEEKPELLANTLFSFVTEEETTYDCIAGVGAQFQPEYSIVVDMLPVNQTSENKVELIPEVGKGPAVLLAFQSYHLHPKIRQMLKQVNTPYQLTHLDINFPPEPQILQRNGVTKAMNVFVPMLGWHNAMYTMDTQDFMGLKKLTLELHGIFTKTS